MIRTTSQVKNTRTAGKFGEELALKYLLNKGYTFLQKNFFIQAGELDLIVQKNGIIHIVEVKMRSGKNFGTAAEALTYNKKRSLLRTIFTFLATQPQPVRWQLDLIAINFHKPTNTAEIEHLPNILEA